MPKGRVFAPSTARDGIWFQHDGEPPWPPVRIEHTTTGVQQHGPYDDVRNAKFPPPLPRKFVARHTGNFKEANLFTKHENRFFHELHGEHLGDGRTTRSYGVSNCDVPHLHHRTEPDFLCNEHDDFRGDPYVSDYKINFEGEQNEERTAHRRFPRKYKTADPAGRPSTSTVSFKLNEYGEGDYVTSSQVLLDSLEPFVKHNEWRYSYNKGISAYPEIRRRKQPCVKFNTYDVRGTLGVKPNKYVRMLDEEIPIGASRGVLYVSNKDQERENHGLVSLPYSHARFRKHMLPRERLPHVEVVQLSQKSEAPPSDSEDKASEEKQDASKSKKRLSRPGSPGDKRDSTGMKHKELVKDIKDKKKK